MNTVGQGLFKWGLLVFLAILPMAETIALRNLILLLLVIGALIWVIRDGYRELAGGNVGRFMPWPLLLWLVFLLLFPLVAVEPDVAWHNLMGQWGESILVWAVGLSAVFMLRGRGPSLWELACASGFLVGLHLLLTLMTWAGLFGVSVLALSWTEMWQAFHQIFFSSTGSGWRWQSFPWGFRGFDPMHGNLGYTASQSIALLLACLGIAVAARRMLAVWQAGLLVVLCLFSVVVAHSRGNVIYSFLLLLLGAGIYLVHGRGEGESEAVIGRRRSIRRWGALALLLLALGFTLVNSLSKDPRWRTMSDKARAGFLVEDPVNFLCNGLNATARAALQQRIAPGNPAYADEIIAGLNGDGGRAILMRVGWQMVLEHPRGLDGSRQSYEKLMAKQCGHPPAFAFAHAHQAWINMALALGWGGALLFAAVLLYFALEGARGLRQEQGRYWAFALLLLSIFWVLRGFADAVYQEHYLQMQALLLGYLWGRMRIEMDQLGGGSAP